MVTGHWNYWPCDYITLIRYNVWHYIILSNLFRYFQHFTPTNKNHTISSMNQITNYEQFSGTLSNHLYFQIFTLHYYWLDTLLMCMFYLSFCMMGEKSVRSQHVDHSFWTSALHRAWFSILNIGQGLWL